MPTRHSRNTVRYYILAVILLGFFFFTSDFGLIDVQKTAIVTAVGIDREGEEFILTSQIAVPQSSSQGKTTEAVQLVSRGKTVSEAFEEINAKTGWYPKLVFCKLIVLGQQTAQENVFNALDFFLLDEYLTDSCQVAVCEGLAKDILDNSALVDPSSGVAIGKLLSAHAERVGTVHPISLKDFAIGHFGESRSALLPVLQTESQQEALPAASGNGQGQQSGQGSESKQSKDKPVFSARKTALFVDGKWKGTLTAEETFAVNAATGKLRLASYSVDNNDGTCTLVIKRNAPKIKLSVGKEGQGRLHLEVKMTAGVADYSKALGVKELKDGGDVPDGVFAAAEKKLAAELVTAYEKARAVGCDLFGLGERLVKYKNRAYRKFLDGLLENTSVTATVRFIGIR